MNKYNFYGLRNF